MDRNRRKFKMKKVGWIAILAVLGLTAVSQATLITVTGANNYLALEDQPGTSDVGTFAQTLAIISKTTGWQPFQYTITDLDLNGVGGANDSVVINLQADAKRVDIRTTYGPMSDAGATCNASGEGIDVEFVSMVVNLDGGTGNGTGTFEGFSGVTLGKFEVIGESATVNGSVYTAQDTNFTERISLANDVAIDYAFASGGGSRLESFDFQIDVEVISEPAELITVSGANNHLELANQPGTSDVGTFEQTLAIISNTTGWQPFQYTITGLDLNGVGGTNDNVVINLQADAKRVDIRTTFGSMSDAGSTCNSSGEGIDLEFVSMVVNIDGGTDNGTAAFKGFTGVTVGKFSSTGETATVNGSVYTAQDTNETERISLANDDAIDYAFASGDGSRLESFDFQIEVILGSTPFVMLELASMFSDDMILQREKPVPVWGTSEPGAAITVEFAGKTNTTTAAQDGTWRVDLDSMPASAESRTMTVRAELDSVTSQVSFSNVLVGEVWLCSGQSNMWWPNQSTEIDHRLAVAATPDDPLLRFFKIPREESEDTVFERLDAFWTESTTGTSGTAYNFSAVAYHFGLKLKAELGVPVGLIQSAKGGTLVEKWLHPGNDYNSTAGVCYNGMIDAIIPFAMRGVIWYQGEANVVADGNDGQPLTYVEKKKALINGWRSLWGEDFPFYYVQLPPYDYTWNDTTTVDDGALPFFWEAQSAILDEITNIGMAVISDSVTEQNGSTNLKKLHPQNKIVPGTRLALLALDNTYGQDIVSTGPVFQSLETVGSTLEITFDSADGLTTRDGLAPDWFELQVADGVYTSATAVVSNNMVILSSPAVTVPTGMRFAWSELAQPNLRNSDGLVASSFRAESDLFGQWTVEFGLSGSNALHGANLDGDALDNLAEYALGGNPTNGLDRGYVPVTGTSEENGTNYFEYVYARRREAAAHGLRYVVKSASNLVDAAWSTNSIIRTGIGQMDNDFEWVTNQVPLSAEGYVRLIIESVE
jgi:sialate O-acetylesterase